jgi:hypothetical protein
MFQRGAEQTAAPSLFLKFFKKLMFAHAEVDNRRECALQVTEAHRPELEVYLSQVLRAPL